MRKAHIKTSVAFAALTMLAVSAQAAITQAPTLPATITITPLFASLPASIDGQGWTFDALGSARLDSAGNWSADVVAVEPGVFRIDSEAGLRIKLNGDPLTEQAITWKNFFIRYEQGSSFGVASLQGERYVDGESKGVAGFGLLAVPSNLYPDDAKDNVLREAAFPEGRALLWSTNGGELAAKAKYMTAIPADWHPYAFAELKVTAVPEPGSFVLMGLGLAGLAGVMRRRQG